MVWFVLFHQVSDLFFHNSAAKSNFDNRSKTGRLNFHRYLAGIRVRTKFLPSRENIFFGLYSLFGIVGVLCFLQFLWFVRRCAWFLKLARQAFPFAHTGSVAFRSKQHLLARRQIFGNCLIDVLDVFNGLEWFLIGEYWNIVLSYTRLRELNNSCVSFVCSVCQRAL